MCATLNEDRRYTLDDFHHKMVTQYSYAECHRTPMFNILTLVRNEKSLRVLGSARIIRFASEGAHGCGFRVLDNASRR